MSERLDYITAIVEEQNITRAAKRLYISQPALTKYINKLEQTYGITLFDRNSSPIVLTEAGKIFLEEKTRIELAEQDLRRKLSALSRKTVSLTIGSGSSRGQRLFPPLLTEFHKRHPDVTFRLVSCGELSLPDLLDRGEIDLAIGAFEPGSRGLESRYLTVEKLRLIVPLCFSLFPDGFSPENSIDAPYIIEPEQLCDKNYIAPSESMGAHSHYQVLMQQFSMPVHSLVTVNNPGVIRRMVNLGMGYTYSTISSTKSLRNENGQLASGCCIMPGLPTRRFTSAAYKSGHLHAGLLKELVDIQEEQILASSSPNMMHWTTYQSLASIFV